MRFLQLSTCHQPRPVPLIPLSVSVQHSSHLSIPWVQGPCGLCSSTIWQEPGWRAQQGTRIAAQSTVLSAAIAKAVARTSSVHALVCSPLHCQRSNDRRCRAVKPAVCLLQTLEEHADQVGANSFRQKNQEKKKLNLDWPVHDCARRGGYLWSRLGSGQISDIDPHSIRKGGDG